MTAHLLSGGFADPPADAAHAFRAIMQAMARPGTIHDVTGARPPAPLSVAAGTVLLTLCDRTTPLFLGPSHDTAEVRAWVTFHCAAPLVTAGDAAFALGTWDALLPTDRFPIGNPEYPDRAATLIVELPALDATGATLTDTTLSGPGIRGTAAAQLALKAQMVTLGMIVMGQPEFYLKFEAEKFAADGSVEDESLRGFLKTYTDALAAHVERLS